MSCKYGEWNRGQEEALLNKLGGETIAKAILSGAINIVLLEKKSFFFAVSGTTSSFVARDKFVINLDSNAPLKISELDENFTKWFLSGRGKVEDPISAQVLVFSCLAESTTDGNVVDRLGGAKEVQTTLTEMFSLMKDQGNGEEGILCGDATGFDHHANLFFIPDQRGALRTVRLEWWNYGWKVKARSLDYCPNGWTPFDRVFQRVPRLIKSGKYFSINKHY